MSTTQTDVQRDTDSETEVGWSPDQHAALNGLGIPEARTARAMLFEVCQRTGLDPFRRHVYLAWRNGKWNPEPTIDGFRSVAESTGVYRGQIGPEWCDEDGEWVAVWTKRYAPFAARVGVLRADFDEALWGTAHFSEYVAMEPVYEGSGRNKRKTGEKPTDFWIKMPRGQIAKCAEALALRRAFPQRLGGLYTADEMQQADNGSRDRDYEQIEQQRNAGEPSRPRRLDPQKGAQKAHAAESPEQVYEMYAFAKENGALAQQIRDPATGETWMFGVYLLLTAASKARDADIVRNIRKEAEPVLDRPIPGGNGTVTYTLGDYLDECITALTARGDSFAGRAEEAVTTDADGRAYTDNELYAAPGSGHPDVAAHAERLLEQGPDVSGPSEDHRNGHPVGSPAPDYPGECGDGGYETAADGHSGGTDADGYPVSPAETEAYDGEDASWDTPPGDGALTDD